MAFIQFVECETCAAKPGTPLLCQGCRTNRNTINRLLDTRVRVAAALEKVELCYRPMEGRTPPKGYGGLQDAIAELRACERRD